MDYVYFLVNRICESKDYYTLPIFIQFFNFITMQKYIAFDDSLYNNLIEILYVFVDSDVQDINLTTSLFTELSNSDNILFSRFDKDFLVKCINLLKKRKIMMSFFQFSNLFLFMQNIFQIHISLNYDIEHKLIYFVFPIHCSKI